MEYFKLIRGKNTVVKKKMRNGKFVDVDIFSDQIKTARQLDSLLSDLSGKPRSSVPAFEIDWS